MARTSSIRSDTMLDPLDRHSRDSTLFQFTTKRLIPIRFTYDTKEAPADATGQNRWDACHLCCGEGAAIG